MKYGDTIMTKRKIRYVIDICDYIRNKHNICKEPNYSMYWNRDDMCNDITKIGYDINSNWGGYTDHQDIYLYIDRLMAYSIYLKDNNINANGLLVLVDKKIGRSVETIFVEQLSFTIFHEMAHIKYADGLSESERIEYHKQGSSYEGNIANEDYCDKVASKLMKKYGKNIIDSYYKEFKR